MTPSRSPDGDLDTLHIRCGSDIREALRSAGFEGAFLEYSDPLCRGPVPDGGNLNDIRCRFIADDYGLPIDEVATQLAQAEAGIDRARETERAVLWFEHDSYDQLILARLLAAFAEGVRPRHLEAVIVDSYPGIDRFVGLGILPPDALRALWHTRRPIGAADLDLGRRVWATVRLPDPSALFDIATRADNTIPQMGPALLRHLQELPWVGDGLSLTQRLVLQAIAEGFRTGSAMFRRLHDKTEPLPFLGDLMLWADLRDMAAADRPPFRVADASVPWPDRDLTLTEVGRGLLAQRIDWGECGAPTRWVGGLEIRAGDRGWRWSPESGRPVPLG